MKVFALAALTFVGLVAAQDLSTLPQCAQTCALQGIGATGCAATDATCICSNAGFLSGVQTCISQPGTCTAAEIEQTLAFAASFCGGSTNSTGTATGTASSTASGAGGNGTSTATASETASGSGSASESASETASETASESASKSASESAGSATSSAVSSVSSGGFAAPTLAGVPVAQLLGMAAAVGAAL